MQCEFEEKSFETQFNSELGLVMAPGQAAEAVLGYDGIACPPAWHVVWKALGIATVPAGVQLQPSHWSGLASRPRKAQIFEGFVSSLILQYKRPERMTTKNATQWSRWNAPYYRFDITSAQQGVLATLEMNLGSSAEVRYASPCFYTQADLVRHVLARTVVTQTAFARPKQLGGHSCWTYNGPGAQGWANPEFEEVYAEGINDTLRSAGDALAEPFDEHLERIVASLTDVTPSLGGGNAFGDLGPEIYELIGGAWVRRLEMAWIVRQSLASAGLGWVLVAHQPRA